MLFLLCHKVVEGWEQAMWFPPTPPSLTRSLSPVLFWNRCLMDSSFHLVRMKLISNRKLISSRKWLLSFSRNGNRSGIILSILLTCTLLNSKYLLVRQHPHQMECLVVELNKVNWFPQESYLWLDSRSRTDRKKLNSCVSQWKILRYWSFWDCVFAYSNLKNADLWS